MNQNIRYHRPVRRQERVSDTYMATSLLGTSVLMPRPTRHSRALTECLLRLPSGRVT